jgi:hypothetical protein|tara:strand:+ start:620 stop:820 length:201 start_codon:yes stop_codon:yes gene_type:complete
MNSGDILKVEDIPKGTMVRRISKLGIGKKLYDRGEYCKFSKAYVLEDWGDISSDVLIKKGTKLIIE